MYLSLAGVSLLACLACASAEVLFFDDFNGNSLNTSKWNVLSQVHRGGVYVPDLVSVSDGNLVLSTVPRNMTVDGVDYYVASGAVNTSQLFHVHYGYFEARLRLPDVYNTGGYTLHSSFWLLNEPGTCHQEIDILEQYALPYVPYRSKVAGNLHPYGPPHSGNCSTEAPVQITYDFYGDLTNDYHVYAADWRENYLAFFVDGALVGNWTDAHSLSWLVDPEFVLLTACVMNRVPVNSSDVFPQHYYVDWVRVSS